MGWTQARRTLKEKNGAAPLRYHTLTKTRMTFRRFLIIFGKSIIMVRTYYHSDDSGLRSPGIQGMIYNRNVLHTVVTPIAWSRHSYRWSSATGCMHAHCVHVNQLSGGVLRHSKQHGHEMWWNVMKCVMECDEMWWLNVMRCDEMCDERWWDKMMECDDEMCAPRWWCGVPAGG